MFNQNKFNIIPQVPITREEELARAVNNLVNLSNSSFSNAISAWTSGFNSGWNNPKFTPEEQATELGARAYPLFYASYIMQQAFNTVIPGSAPLTPPKQVNFNPDGSVASLEDFPQP